MLRTRVPVAVGLALALLGAGAAASSASATDPGPLDSGTYVTDHGDFLTAAEISAADERLRALSADADIDLYFAFVPEFTGAADNVDWVDSTAELNGLSARQYLIGVAPDAGSFAISAPTTGGRLSASQQDEVTEAMLPALRDGDWAGSIDAAAAQVQEIVVDGPQRAVRNGVIFAVVAVLVIAVVVVIVLIRRARKRAAERAAFEAGLAELAQQASIALVHADDTVRSSEQEMEYARAQFGDDVIGDFIAALGVARTNLDEAFTLQQKLDDEVPDTDQQRSEWNTRILQLCSESTQALQERKEAFDALRKIEENAPAALENVRTLRAGAAAAVGQAEQTYAGLTAAYAPTAIAAVADNTAEARSRIAFTDESIDEAATAIAEGRTGDAAVEIRAAEGAVQQAAQLETAISTLADDLAAADQQASAVVADLQQDLLTAAALPDADGTLARTIDGTRSQIAQAQTLLGPTGRDPLAALRRLEAANTAIDQTIQHVRDEQARIAHARSMLDSALRRADATLSAAENYILNRRGAVDATARTRLTNARAARDEAVRLSAGDPVQALALAQRADQYADQALRLAQQNVGAWGPSGGDGNVGALLGGIVLGGLLRGGRGGSLGGGGFGGGFRGGGFGGGGFGGGGHVGGFGGGRSGRSGGHF